MAKRALKLSARIPAYKRPRNAWRVLIHKAMLVSQKANGVVYDERDKLQVQVRFYLGKSALVIHDLDNRLKDVMDALQGRVGGPKNIRRVAAIIPNDRQIYKVEVEKCISPPQGRGMGHVVVSRYKPRFRSPPS